MLVTVAMMREGAKLALLPPVGALRWRNWTTCPGGCSWWATGPAREQVQAALPAERTCWLGRRSEAELPAILANADLFVWPAEREAIGLALLEAAAAGLPVVAAETDGVPAVVAHGETGLLAPPGDTGAFAGCLRALLTDPARRRAMGAAARKRVLARHDIVHAAAVLAMTLLAVIRHGPTVWNRERRLQGRCDIPLDAEGVAEVARWKLPPAFSSFDWTASPLAPRAAHGSGPGRRRGRLHAGAHRDGLGRLGRPAPG